MTEISIARERGTKGEIERESNRRRERKEGEIDHNRESRKGWKERMNLPFRELYAHVAHAAELG